jgi:subtilisin family serine protease
VLRIRKRPANAAVIVALAAVFSFASAGDARAAKAGGSHFPVPELSIRNVGGLIPRTAVHGPPRLSSFRIPWSHQPGAPRSLASVGAFAKDAAVVGLSGATAPDALAHEYGLRVIGFDAAIRAAVLSGDSERLRSLARAVGTDPRLRYVEEDRRLDLAHRRDDPATASLDPATGAPYQWAFARVGVDRALNLTRGSAGILVGVVDSGASQVQDLRAKIAKGWYFTNEGSSIEDTEGHGTFVSSIIAGVNDDGFGIAGFCGACQLDVFKSVFMTESSVAIAIRQLVDDHVRIINLSIGRPGNGSYVLADALNYAIANGVLVVAASGNDGEGSVSWPAWFLQPPNGARSYGLAVGASDATDRPAGFSNWGSRLSVLAPGAYDSGCSIGIWAALPPLSTEFDSPTTCARTFRDPATGARYAYASGTSFSAPEVAGIAALVWAARPELKSYEVTDILKQSATRPAGAGWQPDRGWGVVNAARALEIATGKSSADHVVLKDASFDSRPRARHRFAMYVKLQWQDGTPVDAGVAHCTATIKGRRIASIEGKVGPGTASCAWRLPASAAAKRMIVRVSAADTAGNRTDRAYSFSVRK